MTSQKEPRMACGCKKKKAVPKKKVTQKKTVTKKKKK
jgi:hypothetical protein